MWSMVYFRFMLFKIVYQSNVVFSRSLIPDQRKFKQGQDSGFELPIPTQKEIEAPVHELST